MDKINLSLFRIVADADECIMDPTGKCNKTGGFKDILKSFVEALFLILAVVSVFVIIYAGFIMMTSAGDPAKIKKGKSALAGAIIGLIISLSAYALVKWVLKSIL